MTGVQELPWLVWQTPDFLDVFLLQMNLQAQQCRNLKYLLELHTGRSDSAMRKAQGDGDILLQHIAQR